MKTIYLVVEKNTANNNRAIVAIAKNKRLGQKFVAKKYGEGMAYYPSHSTYYSADRGIEVTVSRFRGVNLTHRSV